MDTPNILVGYSQIYEAVNRGRKAAGKEAGTALEDRGSEPVADVRFMAQLREALQALERDEKSSVVLSSPQNAMAAALQTYFAGQALKANKLDKHRSGVLEAKFDRTDWFGWVKSFFTWWRQIEKHPLLSPPAEAAKLKSSLRIAVLGDWGTGMYGAPICAHSIQSDPKGFDVILHLGDVYYSGTEEEELNRCINLWPRVPGARNYSLNSNHEMYSGGHGYFERLLKDDLFSRSQSSSYFAFENGNFLFICLDTAYSEHDLVEAELQWLTSLIRNAETNQKIVLFSHHQPFSLLDCQGPKLQVKLWEALNARKIFAWYWGHEHRCVVYDLHPSWQVYGRCIGHSGMPYFRGDVAKLPADPNYGPLWKRIAAKAYAPGGIVVDGPNQYVTDDPPKYGPHGYLVLEVNGAQLVEYVRDADGAVIYQNLLS